MKFKKGQEEIVGFGLIIIIVGVILLILLTLSLSNSEKEAVESYEVESFIQAFLQYTTACEDNLEPLSVQKLIYSCIDNKHCLDGKNACTALDENIQGILEASWPVGPELPVKGYEFYILNEGEDILNITKGNLTYNSKGSLQDFSKSGNNIEVIFTAYYE